MLEDDGRVAYAYLRVDGEIVGDFWLYNVGPDPVSVDWGDRDALPFCNPASYCAHERMPRLRADAAVTCEWYEDGVLLRVDGELWARLEHGSRPGWSRGARMPGPAALPLSTAP